MKTIMSYFRVIVLIAFVAVNAEGKLVVQSDETYPCRIIVQQIVSSVKDSLQITYSYRRFKLYN